jgi:hypothetical protein
VIFLISVSWVARITGVSHWRPAGLCVSKPDLFHLTWCPPVASIYLPTTCHYSLWLNKTPLCVYVYTYTYTHFIYI